MRLLYGAVVQANVKVLLHPISSITTLDFSSLDIKADGADTEAQWFPW